MVMKSAIPGQDSAFSDWHRHQPAYVKKNKIVSAEEAVRIIRDGDTVVFSGFAGVGAAEEIALELEQYYLKTGKPCDLTLMFAVATGPGDTTNRGLNHLAHEGLIKCIIGGHWGLAPRIQELAVKNKVMAYNLPQGIIIHLYRNIASGKAGLISQVGLGTFVDPRNGGGKLNDRTTDDMVRLIDIEGEQYLFYKALPINVAVIRGTTADTDGNVTMEKEALTLESLAIAMAARNSGGLVIVQVERVARAGTLNSRQVKIPGILVDCVVVARPENHWQTFGEAYNPAFSGEIKIPLRTLAAMEMSSRKIIARRAAFELKPNCVVNLGIGIPEGVSNVANEERILDYMTLTTEPGVIGGLPAGGINFGAGMNAAALIDQPYQFDFYNGGGGGCRFFRHGGSRPHRKCQREPIRIQIGRRRWFHQHQPEFQKGRVHGHIYGRRHTVQHSGWPLADRERGPIQEICPAGAAHHLQRPLRCKIRPQDSLHHRTMCVCLMQPGSGTHRNRTRCRS